MTWKDFSALCHEKQLDEEQTFTLAKVFLHENGRALFFGDQRVKGMAGHQFRDLLVLDPEWLSKAVTRVLEDEPTISSGGLLDHDRLPDIWADRPDQPHYPVNRYAFLVALMEQLDFSYAIRSKQGHLSLIAQLLPDTRPNLPWSLTDTVDPDEMQELRMVCDVGDEIPGLIPWLIAETHAYQVDDSTTESGRTLTWVDGVFLRSSDWSGGRTGRYEALIQLTRRPQHRLHLVVRGRRPHIFFDELLRIIQATLKRWQGLEPQFFIPCPSQDGPEGRCEGRFPLRSILALPKEIPKDRCDGPQPHFFSIGELLTGLDSLVPPLADVKEFADAVADELRSEVREMQESTWNALNQLLVGQKSREAPCPRLFTLVPVGFDEQLRNALRNITGADGLLFGDRRVGEAFQTVLGRNYHLQLYCEQSLEPVGDPYEFYKPP